MANWQIKASQESIDKAIWHQHKATAHLELAQHSEALKEFENAKRIF